MKISLIVAMAANRAIGLDNRMPWHLPADLKRFKQITMGSPVIMGRKTYEAIGKALPGRSNLIITRNTVYHQPGCQTFGDIETALQQCRNSEEVFVIGGATLYRALLPIADCLYLTLINQDFVGDTFFPEIDENCWRVIDRQDVFDDQFVDFTYSFITFVRQ